MASTTTTMMTIQSHCLPLVGMLRRLRPRVHSQATPRPMSTSRTIPLNCPPRLRWPASLSDCGLSHPRVRQSSWFVAVRCRMSRGLGRPEQVSDAPPGVDQPRAERVELPPQVADVGFHDLGLAAPVPSPDVLQELCPGQYLSLVAHQVGEQPELGG